jgi:predicted helicase
MVEQLGIVYYTVEIVDFIIYSVNDILLKEFGRSLSDENIHIIDPFTGTGTFITRLLQSGLIEAKDLERKYKNELHANEIVLLAYYIAAVNIENAYHDATPDRKMVLVKIPTLHLKVLY